MVFFKRKKKNKDTIDFTLFEKIRKSKEIKDISKVEEQKIEGNQKIETQETNMSGFASMFGNQGSDYSSSYSNSSIQGNSGSFIEQKILEIYEKLIALENLIEEIKKSINKDR